LDCFIPFRESALGDKGTDQIQQATNRSKDRP
jgi:hypothetical protein